MKKLFILSMILISSLSFAQVDIQNPLQNQEQAGFQKIYPNNWEKVKLKGLNLIRLEIPGGWFIREGLGKMGSFLVTDQTRMMIFMPDKNHVWDISKKVKWETLHLKGLNLFRLPVPEGWLVREGWGKIGGESQNHMIHFINDPEHTWIVEKK